MKIAIYGYGNLGKGVECAVCNAEDAILTGIFTRRDPNSIKTLSGAPVYSADDLQKFKNDIDVLIICGGSATDLPVMTPALAKDFCVVDSFDTHANIPTHFENTDKAAKEGKKIAVISAGWDPGMFSINRLYASAILPNGNDYTFWGRGVSQGHSDAIRRIDGVVDARQYTVPVEGAMQSVRAGENPTLTTRQKHTRECFVVAQEGADLAKIERRIKEMPNYFADYDTVVHFISLEQLQREHSALPHGGSVIYTGTTGLNREHKHCIEYSLKLDSNPEFTASVLLACARAADRMHKRGEVGCKTLFDIAPADLSPLSPGELRKRML
ncbi:MAG: diaminopimelate dehydrogenase [Oscillospiraceae bacterium]|nr:diaminopimelate dehydrogenase [Oscillospiraceae bacterium]